LRSKAESGEKIDSTENRKKATAYETAFCEIRSHDATAERGSATPDLSASFSGLLLKSRVRKHVPYSRPKDPKLGTAFNAP